MKVKYLIAMIELDGWQLIQEAIEFHIEGLKEEGQRIPMPHSSSSFVEVQA